MLQAAPRGVAAAAITMSHPHTEVAAPSSSNSNNNNNNNKRRSSNPKQQRVNDTRRHSGGSSGGGGAAAAAAGAGGGGGSAAAAAANNHTTSNSNNGVPHKGTKVPRSSRSHHKNHKEPTHHPDAPLPPPEPPRSPGGGGARGGVLRSSVGERGSNTVPSSPKPSGGKESTTRRSSRSPRPAGGRHPRRTSSPRPVGPQSQKSDTPHSPTRSPTQHRKNRPKSVATIERDTQPQPQLTQHSHQPQQHQATAVGKTGGKSSAGPIRTSQLPTVPPMIAPPSMDLVDAVAQELPDYSRALSAPRRTMAAGAAATPNGTGKPVGKASGGGATAAATRGGTPATVRGAKATAAPTNEVTAAGTGPTRPANTPKTAAAAGVRVVSTRSRLQGHNGTMQWAIHVDTPGGHSESRLILVQGVEAWEEDDEGNDDDEDDDDHAIIAAITAKHSGTAVQRPPLEPSKSLLAPKGFLDEGGDSVIDYEYNDYGYEPALPDKAEEQPAQEVPHRSPHASNHEPLVVPGTQARRQSLQQSSQHVDPVPTLPKRQVSMMQTPNAPPPPPPHDAPKPAPAWNQNRQVEPQIKAPPPPTPAPVQPMAPSTKFIPRPIGYNNGDGDYSEEEEEELTFDGTFDGTVGDDTLEGSGVIPMWQFDEFEKSQTWGQEQDFSASEDEENDGSSHKHENEGDADNEDEDESESRHNGYIQNYSYATASSPSKSSLRLPNTSVGHDSQTQSKSAEGSLDPHNGFLPRQSKSSTLNDQSTNGLTAASDSLADIEDSFAWDDVNADQGDRNASLPSHGTTDLPVKDKRQAPRNTNSYSQSLSSLPEDREYEDKKGQAKLVQRTVGVLGNSSKRSTGSSSKRRPGEGSSGVASTPLPQSSMRGSKKDASQGAVRLSASHHQPKEQLVTPRRRVHHRPDESHDKSSSHSGRSPDHLVPTLASQFADAFLGPTSAGQTTYSENDADSRQRSWDPDAMLPRSVTSVSSASESSSSVYSFGIPGLRARNRHEQGNVNPYQMPVMNESTPFVQLNLKAADGVKVIHTEDEVESKDRSTSTKGNAKQAVRYSPEDKSDDGLSIDEFNADAMPPLVDMETPQAQRKAPSRGLSLLGNRRALSSSKPERPKQKQHASEPSPFETPKVSNRRFLRRNNSSMKSADKDTGSKRPDTDIVKRFFTMANTSFGSMASTGDLMDDADDDGFR